MKDGLFQILFVCTGNICRSPMAEGILRKRLSARAAEFATVASAGVAAAPGLPASSHSVTACREGRIDITRHRSRPMTKEQIEEADLILTMEDSHRLAVLRTSPGAAARTFTLAEYARGATATDGVEDPIGQAIEAYRRVFRDIESYVVESLPRIEASIDAAARSI